MKPAKRIVHAGAAIFLLVGLAASSSAFGQQAAPGLDTSKLDPAKSENAKTGTDKPKLEMPSFDLGESKLQFDTKRAPVDTPVGIETKDPALLIPGQPIQKESPLKPDYFGLKLTTPIR
jgi:hypothetical protein